MRTEKERDQAAFLVVFRPQLPAVFTAQTSTRWRPDARTAFIAHTVVGAITGSADGKDSEHVIEFAYNAIYRLEVYFIRNLLP
ncbi:hypothetical protein [Thalassospira tepidiphila]|uniref:hypothetical protein n=1 Tax=Thalassospira tepidiphila TaxID=393657 RepID=UPI003AA7F59A